MQIDRETIIKWSEENGLWDYFDLEGDSVGLLVLETFAKLVAEHEREACAKYLDDQNTAITDKLAAEIRARGNT